ncbi:MAG: hypothetical protein H7Z43_07705 [Clostridia bacterium]|nr:hypothetical protein [Deltaproteobacteria bacterium]
MGLRFKILWAPVVAVTLACVLAGTTAFDRARLSQSLVATTEARGQLEQIIGRISDYHERSLARAREAALDARSSNRIAVVSWAAEHYAEEMDRTLVGARAALTRLNLPRADERLRSDMQRAGNETERARGRVPAVSQQFAALLSAIEADDPELINASAHELERGASDINTDLKRASSIMRRAMDWQTRAFAESRSLVPRWLWLAMLPLSAVAAYLAARPITRMRKLARGEKITPVTTEELAITDRETLLKTSLAEATAQNEQRQRDVDRAAQNARRAETELLLLKLYNTNLMNGLRSSVIITDPVGRVLEINRAAREHLKVEDTTPLEAALRSRVATITAPLRLDGVPFGDLLLDVTILPFVDESGATRGFIWVCDDVTDAVRLKGQLLASEQLATVGRLSAQVAHEIRNPLSAIGLNAELLQDEVDAIADDAKRHEAKSMLTAIAGEIERLTTVTESYLRMARLPRPSLQESDLNQLVGDLFSMLGEEMKAHNIDVVLELASPAPHVLVDPGQLRQGMLNVVRNAREAMPLGGKMRVRTGRSNGHATFEVADEGAGISPESRGRVFEPFYSTKENGTGLGLSLTHQIISEHGGNIELSQNDPHGLCLRVTLPMPQPLTDGVPS